MATTPLDYIPKVNTGPNAGGLPPALLKKTAASLSGALSGELPEDVQNLLRQQAAEYGVASGAPGSQFQSYRGLRNLGLTSLDRIKGAENLLAPNFTSPLQTQQLALATGTAQAGVAQNQAQLAQQKELEQARLAQGQTQFNRGQELSREQLAQQASLAAAGESGANYRASLGLGGGAGGGGSRGGGVGGGGASPFLGGPLNSSFDAGPWSTGYGAPVGGHGTGPTGGTTYDYGYDNPSVVTGVPYDDGYGGSDYSSQDLYDYGY